MGKPTFGFGGLVVVGTMVGLVYVLWLLFSLLVEGLLETTRLSMAPFPAPWHSIVFWGPIMMLIGVSLLYIRFQTGRQKFIIPAEAVGLSMAITLLLSTLFGVVGILTSPPLGWEFIVMTPTMRFFLLVGGGVVMLGLFPLSVTLVLVQGLFGAFGPIQLTQHVCQESQ